MEDSAPIQIPPAEAAQPKFYVDEVGVYLGLFVGVQPLGPALEVPVAPLDGRQLWDFEASTWKPLALDVAEITAHFVQVVSGYMDRAAQERRYDGILSLCTYATSTDATFAAEGQAGVNFRDACWRHCYDTLAAVEAGTRAEPKIEDFLTELPQLEWPA